MVKILLKCPACKSYYIDTTRLHVEENDESANKFESKFKNTCPTCEIGLKTPHPPKFSMENKYLKYIRELKVQQEEKKLNTSTE